MLAEVSNTHNFRDVDWKEFNKELKERLSELGPMDTIKKAVPLTRINAKSKRWWIKELTMLRKQADILGRKSSKLSHLPYHHVYEEHTRTAKLYHKTLDATKKQHWRDWLE